MVQTPTQESSGIVLFNALEQDKAGLSPCEQLPDGDTDIPYFLIGDDAFAVKSWMMKPLERNDCLRAHIQLPIVQGPKDCGERFWHTG